MNFDRDYYTILQIPHSATESDIKKAYRKLALQYHPDKNPNDPVTSEKFKDIQHAYDILANPELRRQFDAHCNKFKPSTYAASAKQSASRRTSYDAYPSYAHSAAASDPQQTKMPDFYSFFTRANSSFFNPNGTFFAKPWSAQYREYSSNGNSQFNSTRRPPSASKHPPKPASAQFSTNNQKRPHVNDDQDVPPSSFKRPFTSDKRPPTSNASTSQPSKPHEVEERRTTFTSTKDSTDANSSSYSFVAGSTNTKEYFGSAKDTQKEPHADESDSDSTSLEYSSSEDKSDSEEPEIIYEERSASSDKTVNSNGRSTESNISGSPLRQFVDLTQEEDLGADDILDESADIANNEIDEKMPFSSEFFPYTSEFDPNLNNTSNISQQDLSEKLPSERIAPPKIKPEPGYQKRATQVDVASDPIQSSSTPSTSTTTGESEKADFTLPRHTEPNNDSFNDTHKTTYDTEPTPSIHLPKPPTEIPGHLEEPNIISDSQPSKSRLSLVDFHDSNAVLSLTPPTPPATPSQPVQDQKLVDYNESMTEYLQLWEQYTKSMNEYRIERQEADKTIGHTLLQSSDIVPRYYEALQLDQKMNTRWQEALSNHLKTMANFIMVKKTYQDHDLKI